MPLRYRCLPASWALLGFLLFLLVGWKYTQPPICASYTGVTGAWGPGWTLVLTNSGGYTVAGIEFEFVALKNLCVTVSCAVLLCDTHMLNFDATTCVV